MKKRTLPLLVILMFSACGTYNAEEEDKQNHSITLTPHIPENTEVSPTFTLFI